MKPDPADVGGFDAYIAAYSRRHTLEHAASKAESDFPDTHKQEERHSAEVRSSCFVIEKVLFIIVVDSIGTLYTLPHFTAILLNHGSLPWIALPHVWLIGIERRHTGLLKTDLYRTSAPLRNRQLHAPLFCLEDFGILHFFISFSIPDFRPETQHPFSGDSFFYAVHPTRPYTYSVYRGGIRIYEPRFMH